MLPNDSMREKDLSVLLRSLAPVLGREIYTFATVSDDELPKIDQPVATFREREGISIICLLATAQGLALKHEGEFRMISLGVESSLAAVGLTARVATALAARNLPCNVVAAFYHDHLLVPAERAEEALAILCELQDEQL